VFAFKSAMAGQCDTKMPGILATFDRATLETAANSVKSAYKSTLGFELSVYSI